MISGESAISSTVEIGDRRTKLNLPNLNIDLIVRKLKVSKNNTEDSCKSTIEISKKSHRKRQKERESRVKISGTKGEKVN